MAVFTLNPLEDRRWNEFLGRRADATVFHTTGWLEALKRTYAFEPVVYTTSAPGESLANGILLCRVVSWLTGRRLVSLPFTDHCDPLVDEPRDRVELLEALTRAADAEWKYVELRPRTGTWNVCGFEQAKSFVLQTLDLRSDLPELWKTMHASTIRRSVRRAARESLVYQEGSSEALLKDFYRLLLLTRRRHGVPPPPFDWFRNLMACLGDRATIRVAFKNAEPVGALFTLTYLDTLVYKYGCSNAHLHHLGTMPFLFWKAIQVGHTLGLNHFDLGRSDAENVGLMTFKERLGASASAISYLRYPLSSPHRARLQGRIAARFFTRAPDGLLVTAGKLLYRHFG